MRELQESLKKNGYEYKRVCFNAHGFIYAQCLIGGKIIAYEVFRRKINKDRVIAGVTIEEGEVFPSDESFGKWAWTYPTIDGALKKYTEISNV